MLYHKPFKLNIYISSSFQLLFQSVENGQVAAAVKLIWFNRRWEGILIRLPKADLFGLENKSAAQPISNCASAGLEAAGGPRAAERALLHTHT